MFQVQDAVTHEVVGKGYQTREEAEAAACKLYHCRSYGECRMSGWCYVAEQK